MFKDILATVACILLALVVLCLVNISQSLEVLAAPPDYTPEHMRAYQVGITDSTIELYDGNRLVHSYKTDWKHGLDSVILKDNE